MSATAPAARPLHFAAFVMNTTGHIIQGTWRRPTARQTDFNSLDHWVNLARTLERGKFDAIFFADVVGLYAPYRGDERKYFEAGLQVPSNDPSVLAAGVDGINLVNAEIPGSYEEFVDHVVPVLQQRGLAQREYPEGTLRNKLFGRGNRLPERHPATRYRGAFAPQPS